MPDPRPRQLATCLALVLLAACADTVGGDGAMRSDSAGVELVTSPAEDRPLPWAFVEELRIGGADSGAGSFTAASPFTVRTNGVDRITVLDQDRGVVELYDGAGTLLATLGGRGGGPGEFGVGIRLLDVAEGAAVFDLTKTAAVAWGDDGAVWPERRLEPGVQVVHGDTTIADQVESDSLRSVTRVVRAILGDTLVFDSLVTPPRKMSTFSCFSAMLPPMFSPRLVWDHHQGRVALTRQARYEVQLFEAGRLVRSIRRDIAPVATTPEMAARQYPEEWRVSFGGGGGCTIPAAEVAEKAGMAGHLPVVSEVAFGPRGTLWVARHAFPGEPGAVDVFDHEGAYLGTVTGRGIPLGWLGDDRILFAIGDASTGVNVIGVYRIERNAPAGGPTT